ncbi:EAL and GGDEF domain-containing protein [Neptuniibacter sp. QD57_21]|uniref:sensor domain-containing protein n=1 Tax=Neptuniibacter sp. QD57_21 TaxID=3398213 RepID=UPI0039F4A676
MSTKAIKNNDYEVLVAQLQQEIERLNDFAALSSDWFWEQDKEFRFISFSGTGISRMSRNQIDFIGRCRWEMPISPDSYSAMQEHKALCKKHEPFYDFQYDIFNEEGQLQRYTVSGAPTFDIDGNFSGYRGIASNITDLYQARKAFKKTQQQLSQMIVGNPIASFVINEEHIITHWNKACEILTGIPASSVIGTKDSWKGFYDHPRPVMANLVLNGAISKDIEQHYGHKFQPSELIPGAVEAQDYFPKMHDGRWLYFTAAPLQDEDGQTIGAIETLQDITSQKVQEEKIIHQAHFDSLTGLPNRFLALDRLNLLIQEAKRNNKKLAVLFIDLDDFKKVNDTLGHALGDELLIQAANKLRSMIRASDTIGRLGGDEFIVLINNLEDALEVRPIAENLLKSFRDVFQVKNRELLLTTSIGISIFPDDGTKPDQLLRNADSAMYHSKSEGRNAYHFFTEDMNAGIERRLLIEEQMHGALARNEFDLNYQPVFETQSEHIVGAEALLRWKNPALGHVSPDEFIPIAEQTGLIIPIGYFVLKESLKATKTWTEQYDSNFKIAVNLSPLQFKAPTLLNKIKKYLNTNQLSGDSLHLEITEGVLLGNQTYIKKAFEEFSQLGIQISMDDFGTGYSSLNYLRQYNFNTLKIDRSFMQDFEEDETAPALIDATIAMAHALGVKVIAEGVETQSQRDYLAAKACNYIQGYFYSKPLLQDELTKLISRHQ